MSDIDNVLPKGSRRIGPLNPDHPITFTVVLAARQQLPSTYVDDVALLAQKHSHACNHLTHVALSKSHGALAGAVERVRSFAAGYGIKVVEDASHRRSMQLYGRAGDIERAFKSKFDEFELNGHRFFAPARKINVPQDLDGVIEAILGLHSSQQSRPHRRSSIRTIETGISVHDLARSYSFPPDLDGSGQTIGLIEFGGGFYQDDIEQFCARIGVKAPRISVVPIGTGVNQPASRRSVHEFLDVIEGKLSLAASAEQTDPFISAQCTVEVTMDIEILAALAPGAHIVVYFASSSEQELYHAISYAVHDQHHHPDVLSISWGVPERSLSHPSIQAIENCLCEASHMGITVCASTGDAGAQNGSNDGSISVNYPASSPYCLACGGTSGKVKHGVIDEESVWNSTHEGIKGASGGGISACFRVPGWQKSIKLPASPGGAAGRGIPDVAGLADPRHGCELQIHGRTFASAGTSAVAPLWAALVAKMNQGLGQRCGHLHRHIYALGQERKPALRPVLKGNNGFYSAGKGWSACTGYGTPRGEELLQHLKDSFK